MEADWGRGGPPAITGLLRIVAIVFASQLSHILIHHRGEAVDPRHQAEVFETRGEPGIGNLSEGCGRRRGKCGR